MSLSALIAPLVPPVLRHLEAWTEVVGEDVRDAAGEVARRLAALLAAAACAFVAVLMACAYFLILAWDTAWRLWVAGGFALGFAVLAVAFGWRVLRRRGRPEDVFFGRIRVEFGRDRELLERALHRRAHAQAEDGEHAVN